MITSEQRIGDFLNDLASKQSTPGGGGAAALSGSQAAALVSMVANFTIGNKKYAEVEAEMRDYLAKSEALRVELLALADADVAAFNGVSACYSLPKETDAEKAARTEALQRALVEAARVPLTTAERCLEVIELAAPVGAKGNSNVVSDAAVAIYLAEGALRASIVNININLKFIKDAGFVAETAARRDAIAARATEVVAAGKAACQTVLGIDL